MEKYAWLAVLTLAQVIQFLVMRRNGKNNKTKYNPHPPGESPTCIENRERLAKLDTSIGGIEQRLGRIEGKINGR